MSTGANHRPADASPASVGPGPGGPASAAAPQLHGVPENPPSVELNLIDALCQLFEGERVALVGMAVGSFIGGVIEAGMLVMIANLALSIAGTGDESHQSSFLGISGIGTAALFWTAIGLTALRLVVQYGTARVGARATSRLTQRLRSGTFDDYVHASWATQASESEASVQDLLVRQVGRAQIALVTSGGLLTSGCMALALVVSAVVVSPLAAALIMVVGILLFVGLRPLTTMAKRLARGQVDAGLRYAVQSREAVDLSLEIRAFGVSDPVADRLDAATQAEVAPLYRAQVISRMISAIYTSAAVLILLGALLAIDTFFDQPLASVSAIVVILVRALNQTNGVQNSYHTLAENFPFIERLRSERRRFRESRMVSGSTPIERIGVIRFDGVSYRYGEEGTVDALTDVSFEIAPGEAIGIIGPSGSGKSTLIQLLLRLRVPSAGRYEVDGVDVGEIDHDSWFAQMSMVPQDCRVFDATVADNIRFFRLDVDQAQIEQAARRAHIHDEIMAMPDGYETVLGSRGGSLSGGQRQRVALARALVRHPSMLVLDEPTSALDMRSESLVHETLASLKGSVTLFVIAHRLSTLNTCDRILVMQGGRVQAFGSREELERDSDFYREAIKLSQVRS